MFFIFKNNLLFTQGLPIVMVLAALGVFSLIFYRPLLFFVLAAFAFSIYFFRNPDRVCKEALIVKNCQSKASACKNDSSGSCSGDLAGCTEVDCPMDNSVIICPSDGKVIEVLYDNKMGFDGYTQKVSIFLSAFDVHVNWIPVSGKIQEIKYRNGTFKFAFLPKSSEFNERNDLLILSDNGKTIKVRQIAGMVARRICCWSKEGDSVKAGDKYGMIRFGSRIEIFLPDSVKLDVGIGQRVYGGQTVLGRW